MHGASAEQQREGVSGKTRLTLCGEGLPAEKREMESASIPRARAHLPSGALTGVLDLLPRGHGSHFLPLPLLLKPVALKEGCTASGIRITSAPVSNAESRAPPWTF